MGAETSQTLDRGLRALRLLAESEVPLTVTQIATALGINRTVAYRLVATLENHRLAHRDDAGKVSAGVGLLQLGGVAHRVLKQAATPVLRQLSEQASATAHLSVADGVEALAVAVVEPTRTDFHVAYRVGARHPLHRGAAGRAILQGRMDLPGGPGYVTSDGELQAGAHGLAAPVPAGSGIEASVGVVALEDLEVARIGPLVVAAAAEVATRLS